MKIRPRFHFFLDQAGGDGGAGSGGSGGGAGGTGDGSGTPGGGTGGAGSDFRASLPAEYQQHPSLNDIKDLGSLVKSYVNAQSMIGADKLVLPRPDAGPQEWEAVYNRLGRPSDAAKYDLSKTQIPQNFPFDPAFTDKAKALFHKVGLSQTQAATMWDEMIKAEVGNYSMFTEERAKAREKAIETLKGEWGADFNKNQALAEQAKYAFGGDELKNWLAETGLADDPMLTKLFAKVGQAMAEDPIFKQSTMQSGFAPTADVAKSEIAALQGNTEFMKQYTDRDHPQHAQAKARMDNLWKKAFPGSMNMG